MSGCNHTPDEGGRGLDLEGPPYVSFAGNTYVFTRSPQTLIESKQRRQLRMEFLSAALLAQPRVGQSTDLIMSRTMPAGLGGKPMAHAIATRFQQQIDSEKGGASRLVATDDSLRYVFSKLAPMDRDEDELLEKGMSFVGFLKNQQPGVWSCGEVMSYFTDYVASATINWLSMSTEQQRQHVVASVQKLNSQQLYRTLNRVLSGSSYGYVMVQEDLINTKDGGFRLGTDQGRNSWSPQDNDNHIYGIEKFGDRCYLVEQNVGRFHFGHLVMREDSLDEVADSCCVDIGELRKMRSKYGMGGLGNMDNHNDGGIPCSQFLEETLQPLYEEYYDKSLASTEYDPTNHGQMTEEGIKYVQELRSAFYGLAYDFKKLDVGYRGKEGDLPKEDLFPGHMFYRDYPAHAAYTLYYLNYDE